MAAKEHSNESDALHQEIAALKESEARLRQTVAALQKSEEYFRAITQNASDLIIIVDKRAKITYVNPSIERHLGYRPEDLVGKSGLDFIVTADIPRAIYDFGKAVLTKNIIIPNAFGVWHKDGSERILEGVGTNLLDNPTVAGFVMNVRDITERRRAEEELSVYRRHLEELVEKRTSDLEKTNSRLMIELSQRQRAEEVLKESEERLRRYFESPLIGMAITSPVKGWIEVNNQMCSMLGYSREELGRMTWSELTHPEDLAAEVEQFNRVLTGQVDSYSLDKRFIRKDGETVWTNIALGCVRDSDGKVKQIVASGLDITERKRAEEALRESEDRYRRMFMDHHAVMLLIDPQSGDIVDANPSACAYYGYTREEITEMNITDINTLARDQVFHEMEKASSRQRGYFYFRHRLANGEMRDVDVYSGPIQLNDKALLFSIIHDITDRKVAEKALKESEERFRITFDKSPIGAAMAALDFRFMQVNEEFCRILGYTENELMKLKFAELTHPDDIEESVENVRLLTEGRSDNFQMEKRYIRKDGGIIWGRISVRLMKDSQGQPLYFLGMIEDITDRKAAEKALRDHKEGLEIRVRERTALLAGTNRALMVEMEERRRIAEELRKSEETYRLLFENNLAGVFRFAFDPVTREFKRLDCNEAYARIFGYSREELLGDGTITTFFSDDEGNRYLNRLLEKKKLGNYETRGLRKDGKPLWILTNASLRKIEGSDKLLFEGTTVDITARKEAEEQMRAAHRKLRAMASEMVRTEERERQQIATVLHDTVAQTLAAAKMRFESVQDHVSSPGLEHMVEARNLLTQSIKQTRSIMAELSPPVLNEIGFIPALEWLAEQVTDQHGIPVKFDSKDEIRPLPHDIEALLYQATRELLMNVVKHAKANNAEVTVSGKDGRVQIEVSDDGVGLDKSKMGYQGDLSGGFGLFSIRERLKHFGGEFEIQSQKGKGTRITMKTPGGAHDQEKRAEKAIKS